MGLFDDLTVKVPLPDGIVRKNFQTKSLPAMFLDQYEIREDGTLWHEDYDIEDHSDPNAEGLLRFAGAMAPVNQRWVPVDYTGEVRFADFDRAEDPEWVEFVALFVHGSMTHLERIVGQSA